jgi:hypothetical protein
MKWTYTTRSGQMTFEFNASDAKDLFAPVGNSARRLGQIPTEITPVCCVCAALLTPQHS